MADPKDECLFRDFRFPPGPPDIPPVGPDVPGSADPRWVASTHVSDDALRLCRVDVVREAAYRGLQVLVSPMVRAACAPDRYAVTKFGSCPAPWRDAWWARLLRRIGRRIRLPAPLRYLAEAEVQDFTVEVFKFPEDFKERVLVQCAELARRGVKPSIVLVGHRALYEAMASPDYAPYVSRYGPQTEVGRFEFRFMSLEVRLCPWIDDGAVVVV